MSFRTLGLRHIHAKIDALSVRRRSPHGILLHWNVACVAGVRKGRGRGGRGDKERMEGEGTGRNSPSRFLPLPLPHLRLQRRLTGMLQAD